MRSPGHRPHADHKVLEKHLGQRVTVEIGGEHEALANRLAFWPERAPEISIRRSS